MAQMNKYSWVPESIGGIANMLGLNPRARSEGRRNQAEEDLYNEKINTEVATRGLIPHKKRVFETEASVNEADAEGKRAAAGKTVAETEGITMTNKTRSRLGDLMTAYMLASPEERQRAGAAFAAAVVSLGGDPKQLAQAALDLEGGIMSISDPRRAALLRNTSGATSADAAFTDDQARAVTTLRHYNQLDLSEKEGAMARERELAVQEAKDKAAAERAEAERKATPPAIDFKRNVEGQAAYESQVGMNIPDLDPQFKAVIAAEAMELDRRAAAANQPVNPQASIAKVIASRFGSVRPGSEKFVDTKFGFGQNLVPVGVDPSTLAPISPAPQPAPPAGPGGIAPTIAPPVAPPVTPNIVPPQPPTAQPTAPQPQTAQTPAVQPSAQPPAQVAPPQPADARPPREIVSRADAEAMAEGEVGIYRGRRVRKQGGQLVPVR